MENDVCWHKEGKKHTNLRAQQQKEKRGGKEKKLLTSFLIEEKITF